MVFANNGGGGNGTQTAALSVKGYDGSADIAGCQIYNGTTWVTTATAATAAASLRNGAGTTSAALSAGGSPSTVEEFTGEGEVEGPGTGTSDSVPAMLSDGEFVITAKAVKQIGVDKLRKMMKKAEDDYDKDMNVQEEQQMETGSREDIMSAAYGGLLNNPYK